MGTKKLTPNQQRFVQEYLVDLSAKQAAIRAGYTATHADVVGWQLLQKPLVAAEIARLKAERAEKTGITSDRVLSELEALAFSNVEHFIVDENGELAPAPGVPKEVMRAVSSVKHKVRTYGHGDDKRVEHEVEFRLWDKPGTLKLAGRHVGLFPDNLKVELDAAPGLSKLLLLAAQRGTGGDDGSGGDGA